MRRDTTCTYRPVLFQWRATVSCDELLTNKMAALFYDKYCLRFYQGFLDSPAIPNMQISQPDIHDYIANPLSGVGMTTFMGSRRRLTKSLS